MTEYVYIWNIFGVTHCVNIRVLDTLINAVKIKQTQVKKYLNSLTHYGLVTPYGDMVLGQHWLG